MNESSPNLHDLLDLLKRFREWSRRTQETRDLERLYREEQDND
jgi:hypothetical protein